MNPPPPPRSSSFNAAATAASRQPIGPSSISSRSNTPPSTPRRRNPTGESTRGNSNSTFTGTNKTSSEVRLVGLANIGNTCYCNSILQALYHTAPFRALLRARHGLPTALSDLRNLNSGSSLADKQHYNESTSENTQRQSPQGVIDMLSQSLNSTLLALNPSHLLPANQSSTPSGTTLVVPRSASSSSLNNVKPKSTKSPSRLSPPPLLSLFEEMACLFDRMSTTTGSKKFVSPDYFINRLKRDNIAFQNYYHQDAHEMMNFTINALSDYLKKVETRTPSSSSPQERVSHSSDSSSPTWIQRVFEGLLTNETKCLTCETVSNRDEAFLDLSLDIQHQGGGDCSLSACLRHFLAPERLSGLDNKFFCDTCASLQEAEKRTRVKRLPPVLIIHLKRFKYLERLDRFVKCSDRVMFPLQLRVPDTVEADETGVERLFNLYAVIIHVGAGPNQGHYIAVIRRGSQWVLFDDDEFIVIEESKLMRFFGGKDQFGSGYIFFFMSEDGLDGDLEAVLSSLTQLRSAKSVFLNQKSSTTALTEGSETDEAEHPPSGLQFPVISKYDSWSSWFNFRSKRNIN